MTVIPSVIPSDRKLFSCHNQAIKKCLHLQMHRPATQIYLDHGIKVNMTPPRERKKAPVTDLKTKTKTKNPLKNRDLQFA